MQSISVLRLSAIAASVLLVSCGGSDDPAPPAPAPEETRAHDARTFTVPAPADTATTFAAMPADPSDVVDMSTTSRWSGVLNGAAYNVEVPLNWNGKLVMYAHGYVGAGPNLVITNPSIRRYLVQNGFAWAASSYSKNYYDVRAGVEDTNALALEFNRIATANSRPLPPPTKTFIMGHSMGGHVAAAAIEDEAFATARNKVRYNGAVPMCGVTGDSELFDYFGGYQLAAQKLAGVPLYPTANFADIAALVRSALWTTFPTVGAGGIVPGVTTAQGDKLREVVKNLTGGERPIFNIGFAHPLQGTVWTTFGGDGTVNGIYNRAGIDTNRFVYQLDNDLATSSPEETTFNATIPKMTAATDFNRLRTDGLRWVPKANGDFRIPVVTIHTLGDMYVPFKMTQTYRERAVAKGNGAWLVQRAIRAPSHCDFTIAEQVNAFADMVNWSDNGVVPAGDDVLTPATVADANYGCAHTTTPVAGVDSAANIATRAALPACAP
jgi:pimeloyl-ACP methyl ester carboxylesterase